jgi:hypothetical protein
MLVPDGAFVNCLPSALRDVSIGPRVKFAPIKRNTLLPDWDLYEMWPDLNVESIPIHANVIWCVP